MKKILITGISGFAGSFLAEYLLSQSDNEIFGTYLTEQSIENVSHIKDTLHLEQADLQNQNRIAEIIASTMPDVVYHLAALPQTAASLQNPTGTIINNVCAQISLLEAIKNAKLVNTRILIISSADIYGNVKPEDLPIDEDTRINPANPYAVSKIAQDFLGLQYVNAYNMQVVRVRPFNHIGPRQSPGFVISSFAKRIAEIEKGKIEPILTVGNLHTKRDFTDVRDMMRAYYFAVQEGVVGEVYNIGSGIAHTIQEMLDMLLSLAKVKISVNVDQSLIRAHDIPELRCDTTKFKQLTGWQPEISLEKTLKDTLDYWRNIG